MIRNLHPATRQGLARVDYYTQFSRILPDSHNAIVVFHAVGDPEKFGNVTPARLERDLRYLDDRYEVVDLPELLDRPAEGPKQVAVTFDDAYRNFTEHALPVIRAFDVPVTLFVPTAFVDDNPTHLAYRFSESPDGVSEYNDPSQYRNATPPDPDVLSLDQLKSLTRSDLVTLGNHTLTHPDLSRIEDDRTLEREIVESQQWFQDHLDIAVDRFCFPYGRYNDAALSVVEQSHSLAVTTAWGLLDTDCSPHELPRIPGHLRAFEFRWLLTDVSRPLHTFA